jgi:hypothetical protein
MIFYIFTCDRKINYALAQQAVLNKNNVHYYFVYGKGNSNKLSPYIEVDCDESYLNLSLKTFYSMKHFLTQREDIYIKLDDDVFVDFNKINRDLFDNYNYGGWMVDNTTKQLTQEELLKIQKFHFYKLKNETENLIVKKPVIDIKYAEGSFYFIRKKLIERILNTYTREYFINSYSNFLGEDIRTGKIIHELKEPILDLKLKNDLLLNITNNFLSIHPVHYFILDKLHNTPDSEKIKLLIKYNFLNDYVHRKDYLDNINS